MPDTIYVLRVSTKPNKSPELAFLSLSRDACTTKAHEWAKSLYGEGASQCETFDYGYESYTICHLNSYDGLAATVEPMMLDNTSLLDFYNSQIRKSK